MQNISLAFLLFGLFAINQALPYNGPSADDNGAYNSYLSGAIKPTYTVQPAVPVTTRSQYLNLNTEFINSGYLPTVGASHSSYASYGPKPNDESNSYPETTGYTAPAYIPPTYNGPSSYEKFEATPISVSYSEIPGVISYKHYAAKPDYRTVALPFAYDNPIAKVHVPTGTTYNQSPSYKTSY